MSNMYCGLACSYFFGTHPHHLNLTQNSYLFSVSINNIIKKAIQELYNIHLSFCSARMYIGTLEFLPATEVAVHLKEDERTGTESDLLLPPED